MAKKLKFESFKYRLLIAAQKVSVEPRIDINSKWRDFLNDLEFVNYGQEIEIVWQRPLPGRLQILLEKPKFYFRGDSSKAAIKQQELGLLSTEDPIKLGNDRFYKEVVMKIAESAGYAAAESDDTEHDERIRSEREFHDSWANSEDVGKINVRAVNEVCTAPEMRFIAQRLGNLKDKRLLDVGCGLGEASVYFAVLGADVTSSDLSQGMLDATALLAKKNGVSIKPHIASAEDMRLQKDGKFDIIYAGNLLHHVDIEATIMRLKQNLAPGGVFISWDPLAYNPAINVYRAMAKEVRTPDEHPLRWHDIKFFQKHFDDVETRYFWLTTLIIFVIMALAQRRNPNKERFWKVVVLEGNKWKWLYTPLEKLDRLLLSLFPPLRLLCWNVVIVAKN